MLWYLLAIFHIVSTWAVLTLAASAIDPDIAERSARAIWKSKYSWIFNRPWSLFSKSKLCLDLKRDKYLYCTNRMLQISTVHPQALYFSPIIAGSRRNIFLQVHPYNWGCSYQLIVGTYWTCRKKQPVVDKPKRAEYWPLPQAGFGHDRPMFWSPIIHFSFS